MNLGVDGAGEGKGGKKKKSNSRWIAVRTV